MALPFQQKTFYAKMADPSLSCIQIARQLGMSRNTVQPWINIYNKEGLERVLRMEDMPDRPGMSKKKLMDIDRRLEKTPPKTAD